MKLWGGRFESGPSEVFERFSGSLHFDKRLIDADIRGSQAFARALERVGILNGGERQQIVDAFEAMREEARSPEFFAGANDEDVHTLIMAAFRELESLTLDKSTSHYKQKLALDYAEMVYNGLWFTPLRESLDAFFTAASAPTTGEVTLRLYKGSFQPVSRKSANSLYSLNIASFTMGAEYDQRDARGFINLIGLPIQVRASLKKAAKQS